jgi:alanine-synthesizing transaminase
MDLMEFAEVAIAPGRAFGEHGEGYVRIALVENEQRLRQAVRNISRFIQEKPVRKKAPAKKR